ncbi:MAG: HypC/HybG/HupF family hydrogenase formation chaperone [Thermoplasmata archaeon]|nr:MAG: HypC/HybG/HupF family hydrogenase formation chaperone [Thermoplasmata archaeon]
MCLAVPARIIEVRGKRAIADFGGVRREINLSLVDAKVGDYVLVHAGFAIQVIDEVDAQEIYSLWDSILEG